MSSGVNEKNLEHIKKKEKKYWEHRLVVVLGWRRKGEVQKVITEKNSIWTEEKREKGQRWCHNVKPEGMKPF